MKSNSDRNIALGVLAFIVILVLVGLTDKPNTYDTPDSSYSQNYNAEYRGPVLTTYPKTDQATGAISRDELLQTNIKGYREYTYWGVEHPAEEETRHLSDEQFNRYIDNVELENSGVYWGAEY